MQRLSDTLPLPDDTVVLDDATLFGTKPPRTAKRSRQPAASMKLTRPVVIDFWQVRVGLIIAVVAIAHLSLGSLFRTLTPGTASVAIEGVLVAIVLTGWGTFRWRDADVAHRRGHQ